MQQQSVTLKDILITEELSKRSPRPPNWQAEAQAMRSLARQMARESQSLLQILVDIALELCRAGTAGVSLLETVDREEVFRWSERSGRFTHDGLIPRNFSPCGICVDGLQSGSVERGTAQLFSYPERYFTYLQDPNVPIVEVLLLPLIADDRAIGAIWIMSHDEQRQFDAEDVRVMTSLADFTAAALLLNQRQTGELLAVNAALEAKIAEHQQTEAQLSETQKRLELSLTGANLGTWTYRVSTDEFWADDRAKQMHGHEPHEVHTFEEAGVHIHPEDRDRAQAAFAQVIQNRSKLQIECRVIWRDRSVHWIASYAEFVPGNNQDDGMFYGIVQDITEAKREEAERAQAEAALRQSEARLALELADAKQLQFISSQLVQEENIDALYEQILDAAIAIMRSEMGSMQMLHPNRNELHLLTWKGFDRASAAFWQVVQVESETTCGIALNRGERAIVADIETHEFIPGSEDLEAFRRSGIRAVQSTPLISRTGRVVGMISNHWREPHQPSERELNLLDVLARQAADLIEQRQAQVALRENESHFRTFVNASSESVYKMSADWSVMHNLEGKQFIASTTTPNSTWLDEYIPEDEQPQVWAAIESAIQTKSNFELEHRVFREDGTIGWTFSRAIPLLNQQGEIIEWFGAASDISDRKQTEAALRESEEKYRSLFESMDEGYILVDAIFDENDQPINLLYLEANPAAVKMMGTELVGRRVLEIDPNFESRWFETFGRVAKTGIGERHEFYTAPLDIWYSFYVFKVGEPNETRVAAIYQDVSDRKRHDANLAFLAEVSQDLARLTNIDETMNALGEKIGRHFDLSACAFAELYGSAGIAVIDYNWHRSDVPSLRGTYRMQEFLTPEVMKLCLAGVDIVIRDVFDDPLTDGEQFATLNIGSFLSIPLIRNGEWQFLLVIYRSEPHDWRDDEIELTRELANRIWTRLERARAEVGLRESEEKYRLLFNSIDEGYALCEVMYDENERPVDVRYLEVNPAFEQLSGLENVAGKTVVELLPGIESFWIETSDRVAQTGVATRIEEYAEGLNRWLDVYFSRVGGEGSRQIAVVFNDITDRKRTEAQLRRAAELDAFRVKLSDALRSLSDPVQIQAQACRLLGEHLNVDRAYYVENNEAEGYTRVNQNYLRGDSPSLVGVYRLADYDWTLPFLRRGEPLIVADAQTSDIIPEADREMMVAVKIAAHITSPLIKAGTLVGSLCVTESVPRQWSAAEVELVRETAERIWATIIRARAETELRESEIQRIQEQSAREEERQRAETLAELDRAKTTFFSNVSHEFRTPLTLLLAPLQDALSDRTLPIAHRERLKLAHRNSLRLLKLVNTLLDFSRIEAGRIEAIYEPTDLAQFTTELASVFRSTIEQAGLRLIVDCPPLPQAVYVDREMWEKIVLNLLSNAFKFTFEGEITVRLYIADGDMANATLGDRVILQIQDTGTGIAPEHLPHLFERFYQVRGVQARTHEGSGIGLALVHELIRLHGGTIDVSSTVGEGSCFAIALPFGTEHLPNDRLRLVVGDRIIATPTLASTALSAAPYVEEAQRWIPQEAGEQGSRGAGEQGSRGAGEQGSRGAGEQGRV